MAYRLSSTAKATNEHGDEVSITPEPQVFPSLWKALSAFDQWKSAGFWPLRVEPQHLVITIEYIEDECDER